MAAPIAMVEPMGMALNTGLLFSEIVSALLAGKCAGSIFSLKVKVMVCAELLRFVAVSVGEVLSAAGPDGLLWPPPPSELAAAATPIAPRPIKPASA